MPVIVRTSNGSILTTQNPGRQLGRLMVKAGHAVQTGASLDFSDVTLVASQDAAYTAATSNAPIKIGLGDISFKPTYYPEIVGS